MPEAKPKTNIWEELRKPFPKEAIGKLPKAGVQLDYVGHAATTDRLLQADPTWTYTFKAVDEHGNPVLDKEGNLWILLTVGGVTRPGVGDGRNMKERIGDAIRNAAMRYGVALDLWTKEELESHVENPHPYEPRPQTPRIAPVEPEKVATVKNPDEPISEKQVALIESVLKQKHITKGDDIKALIRLVTKQETHYKELHKGDASLLIDYLMKHPETDIRSDLIAYMAENMT